MRIFVEKGERLGKMQTWLMSTETSDARGWFGDTMEDAIKRFEEDTGFNAKEVYERVGDKYVERK